MNKSILIVLALCVVLITVLLGCNNTKEKEEPSTTYATEAVATTAEPVSATVTETQELTTEEPAKLVTETQVEVWYPEETWAEAEATEIETQRITEAPPLKETEVYTEETVPQIQTEENTTYPKNVEDIPENSIAQGEGIVLPDDIW